MFNHSLTSSSNNQLNHDQAREEKNEIHKRLWEIIGTNEEKKRSVEKWIPGSIQYPAIVVQLLRTRFPSPEADVLLPHCTKYDIKDFIKYTSS